MAKFKVGDKVEDSQRGTGKVVHIDSDTSEDYPVGVRIDGIVRCYTLSGKYDLSENVPSLRLTGRPFNVGDMVVIGGEKGKVNNNSHQNTLSPVSVFMGFAKEHIYITHDGRAWPGTPIIAEHDWDEESETANKELDEAVKNSQAFAEYRERNKGVDVSPGFAKDWPIDDGIEDVTVCPEEVRHIAEMQDINELEYRKMPKYIKMALALEGIEVDLKTADLIREIVDSVNAHGGQYDLDTSCNIHQKIEEKYV